MIRVLPSLEAVTQARVELTARGIGYAHSDQPPGALPVRLLRRVGLLPSPFAPDPIKSWDVLMAVEALTLNDGRSTAILDLGCKNSAICPCLAALGFTNLHGIDLDRSVRRQPTFGPIRWHVGDFYNCPFSDCTFDAIVAISTIEHGLDLARLTKEISRLLVPGGLFVFSTDYHQNKLEASDLRPYGLEWTIFSQDDVIQLLRLFREHGLTPAGDLRFDQQESPIRWMGLAYTFLFGVLRKA